MNKVIKMIVSIIGFVAFMIFLNQSMNYLFSLTLNLYFHIFIGLLYLTLCGITGFVFGNIIGKIKYG